MKRIIAICLSVLSFGFINWQNSKAESALCSIHSVTRNIREDKIVVSEKLGSDPDDTWGTAAGRAAKTESVLTQICNVVQLRADPGGGSGGPPAPTSRKKLEMRTDQEPIYQRQQFFGDADDCVDLVMRHWLGLEHRENCQNIARALRSVPSRPNHSFIANATQPIRDAIKDRVAGVLKDWIVTTLQEATKTSSIPDPIVKTIIDGFLKKIDYFLTNSHVIHQRNPNGKGVELVIYVSGQPIEKPEVGDRMWTSILDMAKVKLPNASGELIDVKGSLTTTVGFRFPSPETKMGESVLVKFEKDLLDALGLGKSLWEALSSIPGGVPDVATGMTDFDLETKAVSGAKQRFHLRIFFGFSTVDGKIKAFARGVRQTKPD